MPAATKASLQSELLAAQAELVGLREQLASLSEHHAQDNTTNNNELRQVVWLNQLWEGQGAETNPNTGKKRFRFSATYSSYDKQLEKYLYGDDKYYIAYNNESGQLADTLQQIYDSGERRVEITAFERPRAQGYKSDWIVTAVKTLPRPAAPASHQEVTDPDSL